MNIALALLALSIVGEVRQAINAGDLARAEQRIEQYRATNGVTPEMLEAHSWLARGAFNQKQYDKADALATKTKQLVTEQLKKRPLDADRHLPTALGAAIEVHANVLAASGDRTGAVEYLSGELKAYRATSIRTRIQKNINVLSLEGKKAPMVQGVSLPKGKPALLFFWAHWCPDCKSMTPVLARLQTEFPSVAIIGPTQLYGYAERGREVEPAEEKKYIERIRQEQYGVLTKMPAPVNEENFKAWGASTTPTLVLIDRAGIVRLYHPGKMTYEELVPKVREIAKTT